MNCREFQDELYEYLEGSLSLQHQAAAEQRLAQCAACRLAFQGERETARRLSNTFRGATDSLRLPTDVERRVVTALAQPRGVAEKPRTELYFWRRWAWPLTAAAAGLLGLVGFYSFVQVPGLRMARPPSHQAGEGALVQFSYVVPTYTFRREGGFVVDALTYQTNVVNQTLRIGLARLE